VRCYTVEMGEIYRRFGEKYWVPDISSNCVTFHQTVTLNTRLVHCEVWAEAEETAAYLVYNMTEFVHCQLRTDAEKIHEHRWLRCSRGIVLPFRTPSSRVQTRPKPSDFQGEKKKSSALLPSEGK
jgi:hypothetical protein